MSKGKHVMEDMRSDDEEWDEGSDDNESDEDDGHGDDEVESLFESLSSSSKSGSSSAAAASHSAGPTVVVFNDPSGLRKEPSGTAADWRSFMVCGSSLFSFLDISPDGY